jgi:catechol 2,3-dioxygenase-like lactoylglutathione lyase family enzyme
MDAHATQLRRAATYLPVADLNRSVAYYVDALGFREEYRGGPVFSIVSRDDHPVMLRLVEQPDRIVPNEHQGGTWDVFFWVTDVRALNHELKQRGAEIAYDLVYQDAYQMDECAFRDPDGHVLGFGQERG